MPGQLTGEQPSIGRGPETHDGSRLDLPDSNRIQDAYARARQLPVAEAEAHLELDQFRNQLISGLATNPSARGRRFTQLMNRECAVEMMNRTQRR